MLKAALRFICLAIVATWGLPAEAQYSFVAEGEVLSFCPDSPFVPGEITIAISDGDAMPLDTDGFTMTFEFNPDEVNIASGNTAGVVAAIPGGPETFDVTIDNVAGTVEIDVVYGIGTTLTFASLPSDVATLDFVGDELYFGSAFDPAEGHVRFDTSETNEVETEAGAEDAAVFVDAGFDYDPDPFFLRGDANVSGTVDIADSIFIIAFAFDVDPVPEPVCMDALDVNDSGNIDIADSIYLNSFLFENGPQPSDPYPNCGCVFAPDCEQTDSCP